MAVPASKPNRTQWQQPQLYIWLSVVVVRLLLFSRSRLTLEDFLLYLLLHLNIYVYLHVCIYKMVSSP